MASERSNLNMALMIGVPVLVGASCYYLYYNKNGKQNEQQQENKSLDPVQQIMYLKKIGNQNFQRKNYDTAIEHYTKAIELAQSLEVSIAPDEEAIFYQNRAACNEALGKVDAVLLDCDKAIELKKTYVKAYLRRAKAYEKLKDYDKAMLDAFCASLLDKYQNQTSITLTDHIVKASSTIKAAEAMKTHKPTWPSNQTIKAYFAAFTQDPLNDKFDKTGIRTAEQLQPIFDESVKEENDNDPFSLLVRGSCYSLMSDNKSAYAAFDKILSLDDAECSVKIKSNALIKKSAIVLSDQNGISDSIEKELERVHELLDKAIEIDPENPDIYLHKAQALTLAEKYEEAVTTLNKAIELKPDFHSALAQRFYIQFKLSTRDSVSQSKVQEELEKFESTVQENPDSPDLLHMKAQILTELGYFVPADKTLLHLTQLDPTDGGVHVSRALLQFHLKNDPEAVSVLMKEAIKVDPKIIFAYEFLGSIESQCGRPEEAIKIFETALSNAQSESEIARCYGLLDSAKCQIKAGELLGKQL